MRNGHGDASAATTAADVPVERFIKPADLAFDDELMSKVRRRRRAALCAAFLAAAWPADLSYPAFPLPTRPDHCRRD